MASSGHGHEQHEHERSRAEAANVDAGLGVGVPEAGQTPTAPANKKKCYLLLSNPSKSTHLGTLLRCAAAFAVHQVLLVGCDKFNCQGSFGAHLFLDIVVFPSWERVLEHLRRGGDVPDDDEDEGDRSECNAKAESGGGGQRNPIAVVGILGAYGGDEEGELFSAEGMPVYAHADKVSLVPPGAAAHPTPRPRLSHRSFPVGSRAFPADSDVCFLLSKDKQGLTPSQARMCGGFVHVPHLSFDDDIPSTSTPSIRPTEVATQPAPASTQTTTLDGESSKQNTVSPISQSHLLDTATVLSTVLHHFTARAGYEERTFEGTQKFVKDRKPDARRRLCRSAGSHKENNRKAERSREAERGVDREALDALALWNGNECASQGGDY